MKVEFWRVEFWRVDNGTIFCDSMDRREIIELLIAILELLEECLADSW